MSDMKWLFIIFCVFILIHCLYCWREVWGLRGGYGKGVWSEEIGGYLDKAKDARRSSTLLFLFFAALTIGLWFE